MCPTIIFFIRQVGQFDVIVCCFVEVVWEEVLLLNFVAELKCRFHFVERQRNYVISIKQFWQNSQFFIAYESLKTVVVQRLSLTVILINRFPCLTTLGIRSKGCLSKIFLNINCVS